MTRLARLWRWLVGDRDAARQEAFHVRQAELIAEFRTAAEALGKPRGMRWSSVSVAGPVTFVRDTQTPGLVALLPLIVGFTPEPGSDLEDVPHAREPRPVTALFTFERGQWRTVGKAVFNLSPEQVIEKGQGRFARLSPRPTE